MDAAARETVALALALPAPLGDRLLRYLGLFRPNSRVLSWDRAARLLGELQVAISSARVERKGRAWAAPLAVWQAALDECLDKRSTLTLPLKTHGYLFEIVAGMASKAEGAQEIRETQRVAHPAHRKIDSPGAQPTPDPRVAADALALAKSMMKKGPA